MFHFPNILKHFFRNTKLIDLNQEKSSQKNTAFEKIVNEKGGNKAAIGKRLGKVSGQLIGQYIAGRQKPKEDFFKKWKETFKEDIRWAFGTNVSHETLPIPERDFIKTTIDRMITDRERAMDVIDKWTTFLMGLESKEPIAKQNDIGQADTPLDDPGADTTETVFPERAKKNKTGSKRTGLTNH